MSEVFDTLLPGRPTTVKTRYIANGQQLLRADQESVASLDDATAAAVLEAFRLRLVEADIVILSDYAKGVLSDRVLEGVIAAARAAGIPVAADPKRHDFAAYRGVTVLKPNRLEARRATGIDCRDDEENTPVLQIGFLFLAGMVRAITNAAADPRIYLNDLVAMPS